VAAQGTTLFLATLTGLDFTRWEANILSSNTKETRFDVIADIPKNQQNVIKVKVFDYVSSGDLNKDFAEQGFPGVKVRLLSDERPSVAPLPSPEKQKTPDPPKQEPTGAT